MYVCICKAVTDKHIHRAVAGGKVSSVGDLRRELGVCTGCGKCGRNVRKVFCDAQCVREAGRREDSGIPATLVDAVPCPA